jgi:hypothetical protein
MPTSNAIGIVKKLSPGDDIDTRCGKCKEERVHAIVSLKPTGDIERVQCRTCHSTHLYRAARATTKRVSSSSASGTRKSGSAVVPTGTTQPYSMQQRYQVGDQISHPTFGLGLVVEERQGKIDVRFGRETRTLIHAA